MPKGLAELPVSWLLCGAEEPFLLRWSDFADICWPFRLEAMSAAHCHVRVTAGCGRPPSRREGPRPSPHFLPGASLTPHCTQRGQFSKLSLRRIASWGQSTTSLGHTPAAWIQVVQQRLSLWCQEQSVLSTGFFRRACSGCSSYCCSHSLWSRGQAT